MIKIGFIGYGYWGPNLVRNFMEVSDAKVVAVSDLDEQKLQFVKARYPTVEITPDYRDLLSNPEIDAIVIATPVSSHFELASRALTAGKHVFIEKPLTETAEQGASLVAEAKKRNLLLHVDHTFVYTSAVQKIHQLVTNGELGDLYYYDSTRINLGLFRSDVDVIWDLAVHDLSIIDYIFPLKPIAVSATGVNHVSGTLANTAYLTLFFDGNAIAHIHVNWLAPVKVRRTLIGGSQKMIVYDDLEPSEKIKVYDKGITVNGSKEALYNTMVGYRTGDMWAPQLEITEALRVEGQHFVHCISRGETSISDGNAGVRVVRVLEAATRSMNERGRPVEIGGIPGVLRRRAVSRSFRPQAA